MMELVVRCEEDDVGKRRLSRGRAVQSLTVGVVHAGCRVDWWSRREASANVTVSPGCKEPA